MKSEDLKFVIFGGQKRLDESAGGAKIPPINYQKGAWQILLFPLLPLIVPLLFVQSPLGFIQYATPKGYSEMHMWEQYTHCLPHAIISTSKAMFGPDGFPPELPKPIGFYAVLVSVVYAAAIAGAAYGLLRGIWIFSANYNTYKRRNQ